METRKKPLNEKKNTKKCNTKIYKMNMQQKTVKKMTKVFQENLQKKKNRSMKATKLFRLVYKNVNLFYLLIYDLSISCLQKRKKMKCRIRDEFLFSVRLTYKI